MSAGRADWSDARQSGRLFQSMLAIGDNLEQGFSALRAHKMRTLLTMLGLTMGWRR